jgi:hypothetical protein
MYLLILGKKNTPGRGSKTPKTPGAGGADRFIPSRSSTAVDISHYKMTRSNEQSIDPDLTSPSKLHFQKTMSNNLNGDCLGSKILAFRKKAPEAPEGMFVLHRLAPAHKVAILTLRPFLFR